MYDTRVLTCMTPGSRHVRHPGLGMFDIRVSACSTPGSRHVQHPGVRHKKKTNGTNGTGRRRYGNMQRKERQKEKVNTMFKEYFYSLFLCSRPIIHFFEQYIPLVHTYNLLVTNIISINSITLSISLDSFCTMEPSQSLTKLYLSLYTLLYNRKPKSALT